MKIIGLTGTTGSGKTTALQVLEQMGACIIDCDAVYHDLLQTCEPMLQEILEEFPDCAPAGQFDRKALGRIVFADPAKLQKLNERQRLSSYATRAILPAHSIQRKACSPSEK